MISRCVRQRQGHGERRELRILLLALALGVAVRASQIHDPVMRAAAFRAETRSASQAVDRIGPVLAAGDAIDPWEDPLRAAEPAGLGDVPRTKVLDAWWEIEDPRAPILLVVGEDGAPGRAGVDDDFSGVIDDAGELGAFGSDDRCVTPIDADFPDWRRDPQTRVVGRGTFVPLNTAPASVAAADDRARRLVIRGRTRGRDWVWPIDSRRLLLTESLENR